jgi:hypothetical protein
VLQNTKWDQFSEPLVSRDSKRCDHRGWLDDHQEQREPSLAIDWRYNRCFKGLSFQLHEMMMEQGGSKMREMKFGSAFRSNRFQPDRYAIPLRLDQPKASADVVPIRKGAYAHPALGRRRTPPEDPRNAAAPLKI